MAIFHFSAKVIARSAGSSALAASAYRSAARLHDERLGRTHDFTRKRGVIHSEVMLPDGADPAWADRGQLWNDVEATELRRDAQLAREIEFAIPREMTDAQGIALARDFVQAEFVDHGMVADLAVHRDIAADGSIKPHAHVMLTMREVTVDADGNPGFGAKVREWNRSGQLVHWREAWAAHVNERLAELDIEATIDHRSLAAQGIGLEPQHKIGAAAQRMQADGIDSERAEDHLRIARENGERILADPAIALDAITHQQATFTTRDLAMFVHRHSEGADQFSAVMAAVRNSPELVQLGQDAQGQERFTSRDMIAVEEKLHRAAELLASRERHRVERDVRDEALSRAAATRGLQLSGEQAIALEHVTGQPDLAIVVGTAGAGKSAMLGVAREAWEEAGLSVHGAALSGIAAQNLEEGSGIPSRTLASLAHSWSQGRDPLGPGDVLVIDEAGMVGTRQLEQVLSHAADAGAKVVLVGDPAQLQAIEAGAAFRSLHEAHGGADITEVRRQHEGWQRAATQDLATGNIPDAISAYADHGHVHAADTRAAARDSLVDRWDAQRKADPDARRIILTHTNDEVRALNEAARGRMRASHLLDEDVEIAVERGPRIFAAGDRIMFLRNERSLDVRNGTLGTIDAVSTTTLRVRTDDGRQVDLDLKDYAHIDHGYAATIHKAQGMTVDHTHVLATPGLDRHASYVALSRHRGSVELHYGRDDFADGAALAGRLSRDRAKDMARDYGPAEPVRSFAERRGMTLRERVVELVKAIVPEKVRSIVEGLLPQRTDAPAVDAGPAATPHDTARPAAPTQERTPPELQPHPAAGHDAGSAPALTPSVPMPASDDQSIEDREAAMRMARTEALRRHARVFNDILQTRYNGQPVTPGQRRELVDARKAFEDVRPFGAHDAEAAYAKDPALAGEAARGRVARAVRALQLETQLRTSPALRADQFVARWQQLEAHSEARYRVGDFGGYKAAQRAMGDMARSLERDPQMESLLVRRKSELGIGFDTGRSLGRALALSRGIDYELGRGLGL